MQHAKEKYIDGHMWLVAQYPASEGLKILAKLTKLLGASIASLTGSVDSTNILDANIDSDAIARAVQLLVDRLDEDEVLDLIKRMLKDTKCDNKEVLPTFDVLFMGKLSMLFKVLVFVVEVNYEDFFTITKNISNIATTRHAQAKTS